MKQNKNTVILILLAFTILQPGCKETEQPFDFKLVTQGEIVTDPGYSQGAAWADFDNDGDEDLFVTNSWTNGNNLFYRNNNDGTFTKITDIAPCNDGGNSNGCSWGDVDNDGDPDLFVANVNDQNNFLYLNNSDGTFTKVSAGDAVTDGGWSYTCAWADFNNDGWLDLFVGNYNEQGNFLYLNDKRGNLLRDSDTVIQKAQKSTQGCAWLDYNNDGLLDLYVANQGLNDLYKNLGQGNFEEISGIAPVSEIGNSFGCSATDYNNDGYTDLLVANWWGKNSLYLNLGNGTFEKINNSPVTEESLNSEGSGWGDFDNDGDPDLFITNDGNNSIFENQNGKFTKLINLTPANDSSNSNGMTWNDFDNDGDLDIFIANGGNQPNLLYLNPGNMNSWLKIKCEGIISNKSGIGAKVIVFQKNRIQFKEVSGQTGGGYGSQNGLILHFGLGNKEKADSVIVHWPSGKKSRVVKPGKNKTLLIKE